MKIIEEAQSVLGRRIKSLRTIRGWTQARLAEELEVWGLNFKQGTIAKLEGGRRPTTVGELAALAKVLDQDPGELLVDYEVPPGLVEYAEASRRQERARGELDLAAYDYIDAQKALAEAADALQGAVVLPEAIALSLATTPEAVVRGAHRRWAHLSRDIADYLKSRVLEGDAARVVSDFESADPSARKLSNVFEKLYGEHPEAS